MTSATLQTDGAGSSSARPLPGLLQIWSPEGPVCRGIHWTGELVLGRESPSHVLEDPRISRRHCRVVFDGALFVAEDLGSRNGTFLDGARIAGRARLDEGQVLRVGHCAFVVDADLRCREGVSVSEGQIAGSALRSVLAAAAARGAAGEPLLAVGPTGSGKSHVARHYHHSSGAAGPMLMFSERRLLADSDDAALRESVRAAGDGTLLLTELDPIEPETQGLLLPLCEPGARPRLCVLSREDLRGAVSRGRLREDLYFRLRAVQVEVPPLARRVEEVGFHIEQELVARGLRAELSLVERCVRLSWPGNVRELRAEVQAAAAAAQREGATEVAARHLRPEAGALEEASSRGPAIVSAERLGDPERVRAVLRAEQGNVRAAARALGVHRNQLRRWLERAGIDPRSLSDPEVPGR